MDARDLLMTGSSAGTSRVSVAGWIVDIDGGLFIFGDHHPEDYDFPYRIRILNYNIVHCIFDVIPKLGGGRSSLFYRCKGLGKFIAEDSGLIVEELFVEAQRESGNFDKIDVSKVAVENFVKLSGNYNFPLRRASGGDWLENS